MTTSSVSGSSATAGLTSSSIDVASIVSQLIAVEQQPITTLNNQITSYQSKISALGTVQSALATFQTAVQGLNSLTFNSFSANSSNTAVLAATASSIAKPGNYSLTVSQLAQAQNLAAAGQASATTAIGSGAATTLTFDFGTISGGTLTDGTYSGASFASSGSGTKSITIDSSNNTLSGIRDAINAANIGVTASIINDGSASPYRLVLTSNSTGVTSSMKISVSGDAALGNLLTEDPAGTQNLSQTSAAQNANFSVNGIPVTKSSNNVGDVVPGVTLNLAGTSTSPVNLSVGPDTSAVSTAINGFVTAFNGAVTAIQNQTSYDPTTNVAGTLQGDVSMSIIQSQMASMLSATMGNSSSGISNLTQIGLGFQKDGTIALNTTTLNNALNSNYQAVANLFVAAGTASDSLVNYTSANVNTKAGTYGVNITQMSTQGTVAGSTAAGLTITTGTNDNLSLSVDGTSTSVTLPAGTYTPAQLATQLQTLINGSAPISGAGKSVTVSANASGIFTITSSSYGSASSVSVGGNGASNLFGSQTQTNGLDVAGTINGMAATGSGQLLSSSAGNSNGLTIAIQGGTTGSRGTVSYTQGLSSLFNSQITAMLGKQGSIASETTQFNSNISDAQKQIDALNAQIAIDQTNLTNQYSQLDALLGTTNELSSYLTQQLTLLLK
ncbi:MAG: flagellar filament capping protein FliD [Gallionella sp.]